MTIETFGLEAQAQRGATRSKAVLHMLCESAWSTQPRQVNPILYVASANIQPEKIQGSCVLALGRAMGRLSSLRIEYFEMVARPYTAERSTFSQPFIVEVGQQGFPSCGYFEEESIIMLGSNYPWSHLRYVNSNDLGRCKLLRK